jgi:undecaprenyl pyrophosphate phosphatase UppP
MTLFQYIIDAILAACSQLVPFSLAVSQDFYTSVVHWNPSAIEIQFFTVLIGSLCFLAQFRFDWLGLFSATLKTVVNPKTLKSDRRSLDQHTTLFILIVLLPTLILRQWVTPIFRDNEIFTHPLLMVAFFLIMAGALRFAAGWNKRIKGLNHLRLVDAWLISLLSLLSLHPAIPLPFCLWIGFALTNYHYDALFKYSMLILGVNLFVETATLSRDTNLKSALETVGHLNSIAVVVILFCAFWMIMEGLQKSLSEQTLRWFTWVNVLCAIFYGALFFFRS